MPDTIKEMMSAYVAGCMDLRNLQQFIKFLDEGDYIPLDELGELQNIASLIPILLERTTPPASLQNDIFSQIPEDEIPEPEEKKPKKKINFSKIIEETSSDEKEEEIVVPEDISFTSLNRTEIVEEVAQKVEEEIFAPKKTPKRTEKKIEKPVEKSDENPFPHVKIKDSSASSNKDEFITVPPENKKEEPQKVEEETFELDEEKEHIAPRSSNNKIWQYSAIALAVLSLIFIILYFSSKSSSEDEITSLKNQLKSKTTAINEKDAFINQNLPLISIFELKDLVFVDLTSTTSNGKTQARLILSPSAKRGILQFLKIPQISKKQSLQLWLVNKGQSYSLGVFNPTQDVKYYTLGKIPSIPFDEIDLFRITIEPHGGSEFPQGNTLFFGSFKFK